MGIVIPAYVKGDQNIIITGACADEQNGHLHHLPQPFAQLKTRGLAQINIQQNQ
ncbi:hypothetical protein D3C86_2221760 [compost metagenome]